MAKPHFRVNPHLQELTPSNIHSYASKARGGSDPSLEEMIRRASEGVTIVSPSFTVSQSMVSNNSRVSRVSIGFAVFGILCLLVGYLTYSAFSNKSQHSANNDYYNTPAPFVPLNDAIVTFLVDHYAYDDSAYGGLTIHSINWVASPLNSDIPDTEFVCVRYNSNEVNTTNLAQEYTFWWDGRSWRIIASGDRSINPCR